jgi:two-component system OmpR family sensor kinase
LRSLFRHWPVRWRIAGVSAGLTLLILVCFALLVGRLATDRLKSDFRDELQSTANQLAIEGRLGDPRNFFGATVMSGDGLVRVVDAAGRPLEGTPSEPSFGPPEPEVTQIGEYEVAAQEVLTPELGVPFYVQYAETHDDLDATIERLWILLGAGVLGGTLLALLAGLAVAGRAMRPISSLTAAAREIAATRDPSLRLPETETDDEVAELARTLDEMLRELDAARSETEQMIQAQRDFVADASHELRTPLTSILANLELLEASLAARGADPEDEEIVAGALGSSRRMRRLVSDLLLLAHADAGRAGPRRECDLVEIATTAVAEVRPVAPDHRLQVESDGPVPVDGNPDDLHRLAVNLVENGVRHTPPGTEVAVAVVRRDDEALLEVTDDGPGIPEGFGDQLFARFVRGDGPADLSVETGTGLGLAIVKAVAIAHGGSVEAGRSPAGGARFSVRLPLGGVLGEQALTGAPTRAAKL